MRKLKKIHSVLVSGRKQPEVPVCEEKRSFLENPGRTVKPGGGLDFVVLVGYKTEVDALGIMQTGIWVCPWGSFKERCAITREDGHTMKACKKIEKQRQNHRLGGDGYGSAAKSLRLKVTAYLTLGCWSQICRVTEGSYDKWNQDVGR